MVPYTFLRNDRVCTIPTVDKEFPMMLGREGRATRRGPAAADFEAEQVLPRLTEETISFLNEHAVADAKPFFCYVPLASPHTPIVPTQAWRGRSQTNPYGDFVEQTDDAIGRILKALDDTGLTDRTLVIVTSDNGCSPEAQFADLAKLGHHPSYHFRGHKADIYEGGHRVPYLARWPGHLKAGTTCDKLIGLQDTFATCADLLGVKLPDNVAVDSFTWAPHVIHKNGFRPTRTSLVHHSINGSFAIRRADWKLCFCGDSGGWSDPRPGSEAARLLPPLQLFNLSQDVSESMNLIASEPNVVRELTQEMNDLIERGRSTSGPPLKNSAKVEWSRPELP